VEFVKFVACFLTGAQMFKIVKRDMIVPNIHLMEVLAPEVAEQVQPGQFVIVRGAEGGERIPLSVADWNREAGTVTVVFLEVGVSTGILAGLKAGDSIPTLAGPLGKPTAIANVGSVLCIGGCYGIGSILPIARAFREAGNEVTVVLEARSRYLVFWEDRMKALSKRLIIFTRDGSADYRGHVTGLPGVLSGHGIAPAQVVVNGCTFLMERCSAALAPLGVPITVSLNPIMIDGTGMCGVCRVTVAGQMKFACVDGPDFDGRQVDWKELLSRRKQYLREETYLSHSAGCGRA
jgi:ferredoxin--NADP+ reductase